MSGQISVGRPAPRTLERALTALIQGRNAIERARREVADALEILTRLRDDASLGTIRDPQRLSMLREALTLLDGSLRHLDGSARSGPATGSAAGRG